MNKYQDEDVLTDRETDNKQRFGNRLGIWPLASCLMARTQHVIIVCDHRLFVFRGLTWNGPSVLHELVSTCGKDVAYQPPADSIGSTEGDRHMAAWNIPGDTLTF